MSLSALEREMLEALYVARSIIRENSAFVIDVMLSERVKPIKAAIEKAESRKDGSTP